MRRRERLRRLILAGFVLGLSIREVGQDRRHRIPPRRFHPREQATVLLTCFAAGTFDCPWIKDLGREASAILGKASC
jgi:hypothetical protein